MWNANYQRPVRDDVPDWTGNHTRRSNEKAHSIVLAHTRCGGFIDSAGRVAVLASNADRRSDPDLPAGLSAKSALADLQMQRGGLVAALSQVGFMVDEAAGNGATGRKTLIQSTRHNVRADSM